MGRGSAEHPPTRKSKSANETSNKTVLLAYSHCLLVISSVGSSLRLIVCNTPQNTSSLAKVSTRISYTVWFRVKITAYWNKQLMKISIIGINITGWPPSIWLCGFFVVVPKTIPVATTNVLQETFTFSGIIFVLQDTLSSMEKPFRLSTAYCDYSKVRTFPVDFLFSCWSSKSEQPNSTGGRWGQYLKVDIFNQILHFDAMHAILYSCTMTKRHLRLRRHFLIFSGY